ncbi:MAG: hydrogenase maturation nickel metallochaperone HypA [Oscillospiraceae bacterium]|jgi:hydrogenase nickel incorporation protein HypA/HybF
MHELSVMMEVIRIVDETAKENELDSLKAVVLQVGELSAVVPIFLQEYWPMLTADKPLYKDTELIIETIPGIARCKRCGTEFNVVKNEGWCPNCASFEKDLVSGREFAIKELLVPENA